MLDTLRGFIHRLGRTTIILPCLGMAAIFALSQVPGGKKEVLGYTFELSPRIGNFLHIPVYFVLATLWLIALEARGVARRRGLILAAVYAAAFGALDEVHQHFVPDRHMDWKDAVANLVGALLACLAWPRVRALFFEPPAAGSGEDSESAARPSAVE